MLNQFFIASKAQFQELVGSTFLVGTPPYRMTVEVTLDRVSEKHSGDFQFLGLEFSGPPEPFIRQDTYAVMHENLPVQFLFIVPVSQTADGFNYQITIQTRIPVEEALTAEGEKSE